MSVVEDVRILEDGARPDGAALADDGGVDGRVIRDGAVRADERVWADLACSVQPIVSCECERRVKDGGYLDRLTELPLAMYLLPRRCS